jgi:hypothetical protein
MHRTALMAGYAINLTIFDLETCRDKQSGTCQAAKVPYFAQGAACRPSMAIMAVFFTVILLDLLTSLLLLQASHFL